MFSEEDGATAPIEPPLILPTVMRELEEESILAVEPFPCRNENTRLLLSVVRAPVLSHYTKR